MCPSGTICITVDSCFSELVLYKSNMTATTDKALTAKEDVNPATIRSRPQQRPLFLNSYGLHMEKAVSSIVPRDTVNWTK